MPKHSDSAANDSGRVDTPLVDTPQTVPVVATETVFDGAVWAIKRDSFTFAGETLVREYTDHPGAVTVLALDADDRVLLIKQYRHPVGVTEWELPAGLLDIASEQPLVAAQRELAEEADLQASRWDVLAEFYNSPGGSNETNRIYLARDVSATADAFARTGEEAEIEVRWVPLEEAVTAVMERRVQNPALAIGVLAAHVSRAGGWTTLQPGDSPWPRHPKLGH